MSQKAVSQKTVSLQPLVDFYADDCPLDWARIFGRAAPLEVEIGFGLGEVLLRRAQQSPERNFVGLEQDWERIYKTLKRISGAGNLANIKILKTDARVAFEWFFQEKSIDRVYALFPCPWPKKDQAKHRLFSREFLRRLNNRLTSKAECQIVTDFFPYVQWVQEQAEKTGFAAAVKKIEPQFDTKFERKWIHEGHREFFEVVLKKKRHLNVPLKEKTPLRTFRVPTFDPQKFEFRSQTGEGGVAVIFKEMVFDAVKGEALILVVAAEQHLTQYFRIAVVRHKGAWIIRRAEGQNFLPTPGIARALELVYESALGRPREELSRA